MMDGVIDYDESSNSNSRFDTSDCSTDAADSVSGTAGTKQTKVLTALKKLSMNDSTKFMENFDPERSNRERRKLTRKIYSGGRKQTNLYDEKGVLVTLGKDLCDCLDETCPGCHFPCPKCLSCKCGHECRQNRKWMYDSIEIEGKEEIVRNKFL